MNGFDHLSRAQLKSRSGDLGFSAESTVAGWQFGVSSSVIGKAGARMEERLGVRLLSLSLKCCDAVGDRDPTLRTLHPDEGAWPEPTGVIKCAGF